MHEVYAQKIVEACEKYKAEGDCPVTKLPSQETLSECILSLSQSLKSAPADPVSEASTLAEFRERAEKLLRPFAEGARLGAISGKPPWQFCGADDYERAQKFLNSLPIPQVEQWKPISDLVWEDDAEYLFTHIGTVGGFPQVCFLNSETRRLEVKDANISYQPEFFTHFRVVPPSPGVK